jgi:hypothetical protein
MTHSTRYPGADRTRQWGGAGGTTMPKVTKLLLHTTESSGWPGYGSFYPTLTFNPWLERGKRWRQHHPINGSASTLANAGSYRTNRANVCQVEIVAFCDNARKSSSAHVSRIPADAYRELGEFLAWLHKEWEVDLYLAKEWPSYPSSYGTGNGVRMTAGEFSSFSGVCGHMHAPGNDHGDPGNLNVRAILDAAKTTLASPVKPAPVKPATPAPTPVKDYGPRLAAFGFTNPRDFQCWLWNQPLSACDGQLGERERKFLDTANDDDYGTAILKGYPVNYPYGAGNVAGATGYVLGYHAGDDHATNGRTGVLVHAPRSGTVVKVAYDAGGWGHYVEIDYVGSDRRARFCHLASVSAAVKAGRTVKFNQAIGTAGATGNVTGIHTHYQEEVAPYWQGASTVSGKRQAVKEPKWNRSPLADYGKA